MKTKEELDNIKSEIEKLGEECSELSDDELEEVTGGQIFIGAVLTVIGYNINDKVLNIAQQDTLDTESANRINKDHTADLIPY